MSAHDSANLAHNYATIPVDGGYAVTAVEVYGGERFEALLDRTVSVSPLPDTMRDVSHFALRAANGDAVEIAQVVESVNGHEPHRRRPELLRLADGRVLQKVHYFDTPGHEAMTAAIAKGRALRYDQAGWLDDPDNEQAGGKTGSNVEVLALMDPATRQVVASVRLYHDVDARRLPSIAMALEKGVLSTEGMKLLEETAQGRSVVEVCDLWGLKDEYREAGADTRLPPCPPDAIYELHKWVAEITMKRDGLLFVGAVGPEATALMHYFGPHVVNILGTPFDVDDAAAKDAVQLTAIMMEPSKAPKNLLTWVQEAMDAADQAANEATWDARYEEVVRRHVRLWDVAGVAPPGLIDAETTAQMEIEAARVKNMEYNLAA